ncbi:MAG: MOSC N-terminal beta barrel domain-containing protein [Steroidobacteraceae bacterium]
MAIVGSLAVHPVKSCAGFSASRVTLAANGFAHDREWVVVDPRDHFLTQRDLPRMALLGTRITSHHLQLDALGAESLLVPLDHEGDSRVVTVWRAACPAFDAGDAAAEWLSAFLGRPVRLMRFDARHPRLSNADWTGDIAAPNFFPDGYPILVLSRASVDDLGRRVGRPLPLERFRANVVLDGVEAYAEDGIREIDIGEVTLRLVKPCTRCVITTTDQTTGERDGDEPLRTLKTYRHDRALRGVVFGVNAVIVRGQGHAIEIGQPVALR